jgi:hypothetical protein
VPSPEYQPSSLGFYQSVNASLGLSCGRDHSPPLAGGHNKKSECECCYRPVWDPRPIRPIHVSIFAVGGFVAFVLYAVISEYWYKRKEENERKNRRYT